VDFIDFNRDVACGQYLLTRVRRFSLLWMVKLSNPA
jgi:hypothetical protein